MKKWPDGTPKSTGNAFDWRKPTSEQDKPDKPAKLPQRRVPGKAITIGSKKKER